MSKLLDVLLVRERLELDFCGHGVYVGVPGCNRRGPTDKEG